MCYVVEESTYQSEYMKNSHNNLDIHSKYMYIYPNYIHIYLNYICAYILSEEKERRICCCRSQFTQNLAKIKYTGQKQESGVVTWVRKKQKVLERPQPFSFDPDIFFAFVSMLGAGSVGVLTLSISSTT